MAIDWKPFSAKQLDFFDNSLARLNIADGPVRSGKTVICLVRFGEFVRMGPAGDLMIFGRTERTIKRNVIGPLRDIFGSKYVRHLEGKGELFLFGRRIDLIGANNKQAEEKVRGATIAGGYGNEITLWPEEVFNQMLARMSVPGAQFFGDTNPDSPYHWLHKKHLTNEELYQKDILRRWQFQLDDNLALDPEFVESLKALYTGVWYQRMIEGKWVVAEGVVYDTYDAGVHNIGWDRFYELTGYRRIPAHWPRIRAIDFGYTNAFVCQWWAVSPQGQWFRYREIYKTQTLVEDHAREIVRLSEGERIVATYADHDAEDRATLERYGVLTAPAVKTKSPGLQEIHRLMTPRDGVPQIFFLNDALVERDRALVDAKLPTCTEEEIPLYVWDSEKDSPIEKNDHGCDTMRYGIFSYLDEQPAHDEDALAVLRTLQIR